MTHPRINSPDDPALGQLCAQLTGMAADLDRSGQWPEKQLRLCGEYGVYEWFLDRAWGGQDWNEEQIVRGYLALSAACLTTTFILTQRTGACRRIAGCENEALKERLLPGLASGALFATVGISHLTTSRRHLKKPVLAAEATETGFRLDGLSPWVTGGAAADVLVLGATLVEHGEPTDQQLLLAVPADLRGVVVPDPLPLVGVTASSTGPVNLSGVEVAPRLGHRRAGGQRDGERHRRGHRRPRNFDAGHRTGRGGHRLPCRRSPEAARFVPAAGCAARRAYPAARRPAGSGAGRRSLHQGIAPPAGE